MLELRSCQLQDLNKDAAGLDHVEVIDEEVDLISFQAFLLDVVQKLPRVPELKVLHKNSDQVGLLLDHAGAFVHLIHAGDQP